MVGENILTCGRRSVRLIAFTALIVFGLTKCLKFQLISLLRRRNYCFLKASISETGKLTASAII